VKSIVFTSKLNHVWQKILEKCKNCIQKQGLLVIFSRRIEDALNCIKLRLSVTFSLLVQIEWIKASNVDKNLIFIIIIKNKKSLFCDFF